MAFRSKILTPKRKPQLTAVLSTAIWGTSARFSARTAGAHHFGRQHPADMVRIAGPMFLHRIVAVTCSFG